MWKVLFWTTDPAVEEVLALIGGQLEIPKGYSQLRFLYQKAFFQHALFFYFERSLFWRFLSRPKHHSEDFDSEGSSFRISE